LKNLFAALCALLLPFLAAAQLSISGKVTDQKTGDALPGATVGLVNQSNNVVTDINGRYRIDKLKPGTYTIKVSYIGYQTTTKDIVLNADILVDFPVLRTTLLTEEITVTATRASNNAPTAFTNLNKKDLEKNNSGRGFEYLLEQTPSTVVSSNSGAGIGYSSIRIRGSDATRTNVTINGVPINDAEDQGVYFVDLPDLASSVDNVQVQRGVGTSTNGAGAFGASINIQTTTRRDSAYLELNNTFGSYGTIKNTIAAGTGLLCGHFTLDGRASDINSNGYIDRAFSHLKSFFFSAAYYGKQSMLRFNVIANHEQTYQAWDGVPEDSVKAGRRTYNELGYINSSNTFYKNQTDNYWQNYYQLLYNQQLSSKLSFSGALFFTKGYGYYEEYKNDQVLSDYGIAPVKVGSTVVSQTDLIRDLWLNNNFYGATYNFVYKPKNNLTYTLGGAVNEYDGAHYDNIQSTITNIGLPTGYEYDRNNSVKTDFNIFARAEYRTGKFLLYADMQYRHIFYSFLGFDQKLNNVQEQATFNFFNPKAGITYLLNDNSNIYASVAIGNHEPNRSDFINSTPIDRPKSENLTDIELGYRVKGTNFNAGVNGYYMIYSNQLILTGALDYVGEAVRTNVKDSYRAGVEFYGSVKLASSLRWAANATISTNKVSNFQQYLFNYDTNTTNLFQYNKTDIAYSPDFTAASTVAWTPIKNGEIAFITKYVSRQYLDNTSTLSRSLDGYVVNDLRLNYNFSLKGIKNVGVGLLVNNIFSKKYQSDGATYPDIEGGKVVNYNYFYPQAPANFLFSLNLKF
jgi:iron complex outermembrane receptor protein